MSKFTMRFSALACDSSDEESFGPSSPSVVADWRGKSVDDAELRARFQSLCRANGLAELFAEERYLESCWSATPVQVWRSELLGEHCRPEEDRVVLAKPIGQVGVWGAIFEDDLEELTEKSHAEWLALDHAKLEAEAKLAAVVRLQSRIVEKVGDESRRALKRGEEVHKKACPCARLYSCVGDKSTGGARPTTKHVSSECWSHERICPQTRALLKPHKCPWLHPGEPGWQKQWDTDRLWKPAAAPVALSAAQSRFAALVGGAPPPVAQPVAPPKPAPWAKTAIVASKPSAAPVYKYGRLRPGGKFDNSSDEAEARSEWIESQKDRRRNRDN